MFEAYIENDMDVKKKDSCNEDEKLVISAKKNLSEFRKIYEKWLNDNHKNFRDLGYHYLDMFFWEEKSCKFSILLLD